MPYLAQSADTFNYSNRLLLNDLFSNVLERLFGVGLILMDFE